MKNFLRCMLVAVAIGVLAERLSAGGSGLNVVVVVNQASSNSVELGNYYCERRKVPPQNVLRVNWVGSTTDWTRTNLDTVIRTPLNAMLASRSLSNQIDFIVLSMDFPYRVNENTGSTTTSGYNSTTSALFYGFKTDDCDTMCPAGLPSCNLPSGTANAYAGSEAIFRQRPPISATSNSWLTMMITASNLAQAKAIVDRGVVADDTFPTRAAYLAKTFDLVRSSRYTEFDDAVFDARIGGTATVQSTNIWTSDGLGSLLGFLTGVQSFPMQTNSYVPGAMADNLTSYSGDLFGTPDHTRVLDFIHAGATASYGTVVEPCAYLEKFASARNYFYQSRGFTIAECYYQSITNPYQGILVGEPIAAPFARPGSGFWVGLPDNALFTGTTNLSLQFSAADITRPLQQVDLFMDGTLMQSLTNVAPKPGNVLYVTLPGRASMSYVVPANATLATVAGGVANLLNSLANNIATKVDAYPHGDRVELRSNDPNRSGAQTTLAVSNYVGNAVEMTAYIRSPLATFPDTIAYGRRAYLVGGTLVVGDTLILSVTKTNAALVAVAVTNSASASLADFVQLFATAINSEPALQGVDGLVAEDLLAGFLDGGVPGVQFNLRSRSPGIKASQIQATVSGTFTIVPFGPAALQDNLADLQPRNHLYLTAGRTNLNFTFPFNTTTNSDGYHELIAVAYEGSHVRTQTRTSSHIRIQNTTLAASFDVVPSGTNIALESTLQFMVAANAANITKIELFGNGGLIAATNGASNATFTLPGGLFGVGLQPIYAVVTRTDGKQYRTETKVIRIIGPEQPFQVSIAGRPPTLTWPATAGRGYQVLTATEVTNTFTPRATVTPTNSTGLWSETNSSSPQRLYRVKTP